MDAGEALGADDVSAATEREICGAVRSLRRLLAGSGWLVSASLARGHRIHRSTSAE